MNKGIKNRMEVNNSSGSGMNTSIMDWSNVRGNVDFYKPEKGKNKIIIVPFYVKSMKHPLVHKGKLEIGDLDYMLDIWVHRKVGPAEQDIVCLKQYGLPCPVCEEAQEFKSQGKVDESKALRASRRAFYNVIDIENDSKTIKILSNVSFKLFEKELIGEATSQAEEEDVEGGMIPFADPEEGNIISFRAEEESLGKNTYLEFKSFRFRKRDMKITNYMYRAVSFDEILVYRDYTEIKNLMMGEVDSNEEEEEERKPVKKKEVKEEEQNKCPNGYEFGIDTDKYEECDDCPGKIYNKCLQKYKENNK